MLLRLILYFACLSSIHAETSYPITYFTSSSKNKFDQPVGGLTYEQEDQFVMGRSFFTIPWVTAPSVTTARDGLGPLFNANTCHSCHQDGLNSSIFRPDGQPTRALVFKLSQPSMIAKKSPHDMVFSDPVYGEQLQLNGGKAVPFEATPALDVKKRIFTYHDGRQVILREFTPLLKNLNYGELSPKTKVSLRQPSSLVGLGLVSQLSDEQILANADPDDKNKDGISGRPNRVFDPVTQKVQLGRFGHKAQQASVLSQTATASAFDMGLTNPIFPNEICTESQTACQKAPKGRKTAHGELDLPEHRMNAIAFYLKHLKAPKPDFAKFTPEQKRGQTLFKTIGCQSCHVDTFTTPNGTTFHPYSDYLLHYMGERLSDRAEFNATAGEWRTAPLMGIGAKIRNKRQFLHDGRARTPEEAVLWHNGEAKMIINKFKKLPLSDRQALFSFLEAL